MELVSRLPVPRSASAGGDFAAWASPHLPAMARLAARLAPSADRDDVVQDALARAWRKRSSYDETRGSAQAWLLAIVADQAGKARRRARASYELVEVAGEQPVPDVDVERALATLSRRQRLAVELHYFLGLSVAESAQVMRCAPGTVKSTLSDARARMRPLLEERA